MSSYGLTSTSTLLSVGGSSGRSLAGSVSRFDTVRRLKIVFPVTFPKIVCLPFNHSQLPSVKKNWHMLLSRSPPFAIASKPRWLKRSRWCTSSLNGRPPAYDDEPPSPVPVRWIRVCNQTTQRERFKRAREREREREVRRTSAAEHAVVTIKNKHSVSSTRVPCVGRETRANRITTTYL